MNSYIYIKFDKLVHQNNTIAVFKEVGGNKMFPMLIPKDIFYYLEKIYSDKLHQEKFMVDIVFELENPKGLFLERKHGSYFPYYISKTDQKKELNIIDLLIISIRYETIISLSDIFFEDQEDYYQDISKVDLYNLKKIDFENIQH